MAYKLTIDGEDQTEAIRLGQEFQAPSFEMEQNVRSLLKFDVELEPSKDAVVVSYAKDGTTKVIGGVLAVRDPIEVIAGAPTCTRCEVDGFEIYTDWCYWSKTYTASKTLKEILTDIVGDKLDDYGISLDGSQVDGPTFTASALAPLRWTNRRVSDVLRDMADASGYMLRIDADKVLKMFEAGSEAGPALSEANGDFGSLTWRDSDKPRYNRVVGEFGPLGTALATMTWTANGTDTSWPTDIPAAEAPPLVYVDNGVDDPFLATVGDGAMFEFDIETSSLEVGTYGTPTNGTVLTLGPTTEFPGFEGYLAQFPFTIRKGTGTPPREYLVQNQSITDYAFADATADVALSRIDQDVRVFTFTTLVDGIAPGQTITIDAPSRDLDDVSAIVTRVTATLHTALFWVYTVVAEEAAVPQRDYLSGWRELTTGGSSSRTDIAVTPATSSGAGGWTHFLGGKRDQSDDVGTTLTPVIDWMPFVVPATGTYRIRVFQRTRAAGVTVTPHIEVYSAGTWTSVANGAAHTGTSEDETTFVVALNRDDKCRLAYVTDTAGASAYCLGQVENVT